MKTIKELKEEIKMNLCAIALNKFNEYPIFLAKIYYDVLGRNKTTIHQLFYGKNELNIQMCRHEIHYILHELFAKKKSDYKPNRKITLSLAEIGRLTGKNHSCVLNSIRVIGNEFDTKPKYKAEFTEFFNSLNKLNNLTPDENKYF